jgi:hypothetical protein
MKKMGDWFGYGNMRAKGSNLRHDRIMPIHFTTVPQYLLVELQIAEKADKFLRDLLHVSNKLNQFERELTGIAEDVVRFERTAAAANFGHELWQLNGHRRYAELQVRRLRALLDPALLAYASPQRRTEALCEIHSQIERAESALREVRLFWRELSATYHFMLGIKGMLV